MYLERILASPYTSIQYHNAVISDKLLRQGTSDNINKGSEILKLVLFQIRLSEDRKKIREASLKDRLEQLTYS